jgi:hypothetical protein
MRSLVHVIFITALIAGVSACSPRETVELVVIGNAFGSNTIPQLYEAAVAGDLEAKVNSYFWMKPAAFPATYLEYLKTETELRRAVKKADVILISFSPSWGNAADNMYFNDLCGGEDNQDCQRKTTAKAKRDWIGIVNTIAELRDGQPVILRVISWGDWVYPAYYGDTLTPEDYAALVPYFHEYQSLQASIPGVGAALAFAEAYNEIPSEFFTDGLHLSDVGSAAVVDLVRDLGYEPAVIEGLADLTFTFNETGCAVTPLEGDIPNPLYIRVENPTDGDNAVVIFTLQEGFDAQDVLDFKGDGLPPFVKDFVTHLAPGLNSNDFYEVTLNDGGENYVVCGQDGVGALAVPLILKP